METGLQALNKNSQMMMWAERIAECRNSQLPVKTWCTENGVSPGTFYKWQRKLFVLANAQQGSRFTEITHVRNCTATHDEIAVTLQINRTRTDVHNGADMATVEAVLRLLQSC